MLVKNLAETPGHQKVSVQNLLVLTPTIICVLSCQSAMFAKASSHAAVTAKPKSSAKKAQVSLRRAEFYVGHAGCGVCIRRMERVLRQAPGVRKAEIDVRRPFAAIIYFDAAKTSLQRLWQPFAEQGYTLVELRIDRIAKVPPGTLFTAGIPKEPVRDFGKSTVAPRVTGQ